MQSFIWFILPLCVYLQRAAVPLPSYTPRLLACVNRLLTEANVVILFVSFFSLLGDNEFARESKH